MKPDHLWLGSRTQTKCRTKLSVPAQAAGRRPVVDHLLLTTLTRRFCDSRGLRRFFLGYKVYGREIRVLQRFNARDAHYKRAAMDGLWAVPTGPQPTSRERRSRRRCYRSPPEVRWTKGSGDTSFGHRAPSVVWRDWYTRRCLGPWQGDTANRSTLKGRGEAENFPDRPASSRPSSPLHVSLEVFHTLREGGRGLSRTWGTAARALERANATQTRLDQRGG
jgi:hypothetical protein